MKHITPIINVTNDCNLGCKYCYTGSAFYDLSKRDSINEKFTNYFPLLCNLLDQLMVYNNFDKTMLIFHGGEPLLITIENWEKTISYIKEKNYPFIFSVQTNGTMINEEYLNLFKKYKFDVGVSMDGTQELNDITRPLKNGKSSFPLVFKNLLRLKEYEINFGVLVTLNKSNINHIEDIYSFFKSHGIHFSIRPIFQSKFSDNDKYQLHPDEYGSANCRLFDLWFDDEEVNISMIEEFPSMIAQFVNPIEGLVSCNFTKKCSENFISFDINGDITPCNRFQGEKDFVYGNLQLNTLEELMNNNISKPLRNRWESLAKTECNDCEIKEYCFGGCPANSLAIKNNYFEKDYYCSSFKTIFHHINDRINKVIEKEKMLANK